VAIGLNALVAQTNATAVNADNVAVGFVALGAVNSGVNNTAVGALAGDRITTGDNNICIGYEADASAAGNDNSIVIGANITAASNDFSYGKVSNIVTNDFDADAAFSRSSDERLKKNITNQTLGLDFINDLRTVKYNWKASAELDANDAQLAHLREADDDGNIINHMNTDVLLHNFIAQEVKAALDTAGVSEFGGWKEDQYGVQSVSREMFVIPLVKAVQELSTALDAAVSANTALAARVKTLEDA
jgi:hypothetical protein